jgi:hypothetical protein
MRGVSEVGECGVIGERCACICEIGECAWDRGESVIGEESVSEV